MSRGREWIILEHWPDGVVARRVSTKGIRYVACRRAGERQARTWPDTAAARAAIQRLAPDARIVA
jgi:hypothetical protein